jgi:hypothetical protein
LLVSDPLYPRGKRLRTEADGSELSVYDGTTEIRVPVKVESGTKPGRRDLRVKVRYQPCSERECLAPETVELTVPVGVAGPR